MNRITGLLAMTLLGIGCADVGRDQTGEGADSAGQGAEVLPPVMSTDGNRLLDSDGKVFLARGVEGWFGPRAQGDLQTWVDAIASQGFNAVRMQLLTTDLALIEEMIQRFHAKGMVVYLTDDNMPGFEEADPLRGEDWFSDEDVVTMIQNNQRNLVIDATIEEPGDGEGDVPAWFDHQVAMIEHFRDLGYTVPLTIGTVNFGRYLRGLLDHANELREHDPLDSLVFNAQMYWGKYSGPFSYQGLSDYDEGDLGISQAAAEVAQQDFVVQWGLDASDDGGNNAAVPFEHLMTETQEHHIGTMWWEWKDPGNGPGDANSLVFDQLEAELTELGEIVINSHPASIRKTSRLVRP
jgi:hypothetical protein